MNFQTDKIKQITASILIGLLPLLIIHGIFSPGDQEKLEVTAFELIENGTSKIQVLIKNIGTNSAEDIRSNVQPSYDYVNYISSDSIPVKETLDENRVLIERLAPESFVLINFEKSDYNKTKTVWVSYNKETIFLHLSDSIINQGISSVNLNQDRENTLYAITIFGFSILVSFRFVNFYRVEMKRKEYLGVHNIAPVKFRSQYLGIGLLILFFAFSAAIAVDEYYVPEPILDYSPFQIFNVTSSVSLDDFNNLKNPTPVFGTQGSIVFFFAIIAALIVSNKDIDLPKFEWNLKPTPSAILIKQTSFSFLKSKQVSNISQIDREETDIEIYVVKLGDKVQGLINKEEMPDLDMGKKPKARTILKNKELSSPSFNKEEQIRENFIVINENKNLEELKIEMEKNYKKFAVVENDEKEITGVLNYDDFFGKHISL